MSFALDKSPIFFYPSMLLIRGKITFTQQRLSQTAKSGSLVVRKNKQAVG
jgi:hypothetical protein